MIRGIGITQWESPFNEPDALCGWAKDLGLDTVSMEFDAERCRDEETAKKWALAWKNALEQNGLLPSVLAVNVLCDIGMNQKKNEERCREILDLALYTAYVMEAPAVHLPSFFDGEIRTDEELEQTIRMILYAETLGEKYHVLTGHEAVLSDTQYERILEKTADTPCFFMLFDNENLAKCGIDPLGVWKRYHTKMPHAHLKHMGEDGLPHPLGDDTRFGGPGPLLEQMKKDQFDGWIILESGYKKAGGAAHAAVMIEEDMRYVRAFFEK